MVKVNFMGGGPFDVPSGQVTMENPDGVSQTYGAGTVHNSLTNADYVYGGYDGHGYGWKPGESPEGSLYPGGARRDKFRID